MKMYKKGVVNLSIKHCGKCPYRKHQRYERDGYTVGRDTICTAKPDKRNPYPSVQDHILNGGMPDWCPLPDQNNEAERSVSTGELLEADSLFNAVIKALFEEHVAILESLNSRDSLNMWMKDLLEIKKIAEKHTGK